MNVKQVYELTNELTKEVLGKEDIVNEDLSNVVDVGEEVLGSKDNIDNYVRKLVDRIGKTVIVNRTYGSTAPSVLMDGWEYGSILQKITMDNLPEATENESWELTNGTSYDPNIFNGPSVSAKYFNSKTTLEIDMSFTRKQLTESFSDGEHLNAFNSMIENGIRKSLTVKSDGIVMRTIINMIAETIYSEYQGEALNTKSGVRAVNLLKKYNDKFSSQLTAEQAITTPEFIRYASFIIGLYQSRMTRISTLFNMGGKDRFTPSDMQHIILLADFANAAKAYLQSDTYHDQFVALPNAETVPYWQGSGIDYNFASTSKINVKTAQGNTVEASGILGVLFDRDALGVCNYDPRTLTQPNQKAEFINSFYKIDSSYFNDGNENFVVFFVA